MIESVKSVLNTIKDNSVNEFKIIVDQTKIKSEKMDVEKKYELDLASSIEVIRGELCLWKVLRKIKSEKACTAAEAYKSVSIFPNVERLVKILCVLPFRTIVQLIETDQNLFKVYNESE